MKGLSGTPLVPGTSEFQTSGAIDAVVGWMVAVNALGGTGRVKPFKDDLIDVGSRRLRFNLGSDRAGRYWLAERTPERDRGQGERSLVARNEVKLGFVPV